jgi:DNA-binding NarL/FixJ family response regulator
MTSNRPTRVVLVEDDPRYRRSLEILLHHTPEFQLAEAFGNPRSMLKRAEECGENLDWNLVLMDLELPQMNGIEGTKQFKLKHPDIPVVVLTAFEEPATILQAICAGADGYLLKKAPARDLLSHLRTVTKGGASLTGEIARSVLEVVRQFGEASVGPDDEAVEPKRLRLTAREQDVLRSLSHGLSYGQVAESLDVSLDTVRDHIRRIYKKLHVHSAAEAVSRAVREGLI